MRRGWTGWMAVLLSAVLLWPAGAVQGKESLSPPSPKRMGEFRTQPGKPGTWSLGETPPNMDPSKPPIVFVHGLHGTSDSWRGDTKYHGPNDMYEIVYSRGYRTAFVELNAESQADDMWTNGRLLASMLKQIHQHFGERVNIVAHSKGGVDSQAALVHSSAWPYVGRVITLGSPHRGSHLADLAYSWWAGWLAELLGRRDAGTECLQTGYMEYFRSVTDSNANVSKNSYFTAAGTNWGPFPSSLWLGGAYLSPRGSNDGLVNVWSTYLPYGRHLFTADVDHDALRKGSTSFPRIESVLGTTAKAASTDEKTMAETAAVSGENGSPGGEQLVRGGPIGSGAEIVEEVPVESGQEEILFHVMAGDAGVGISLRSPSGKVYTEQSPHFIKGQDTEIFKGAAVQAYRIDRPEAGTWKVRLKSKNNSAYLLAVSFTGATKVQTKVKAPTALGQEVPVRLDMKGTDLDPKKFHVRMRLSPPGSKRVSAMKAKGFQGQMQLAPKDGRGSFTGKLPPLKTPGVYNLTLDIEGKNDRGERFQRTEIRSFYVPAPDKKN
ncbi:esterase/lipase family protein [Salinithrix halophila]|uniref:Esterase/lipase family protein n=1 Tax=Salinithrix halophila TaxID=1485204 RepID=A0ABV8JI00_9BACL